MEDLTTALKLYPIMQELSRKFKSITVDIAIHYITGDGDGSTAKYHCNCWQGEVTISKVVEE